MKEAEIQKRTEVISIDPSLELVGQKERQMPGSLRYLIQRYSSHNDVPAEDTGMMTYHYHQGAQEESYLELRYCITGNRYCNEKDCSKCALDGNDCKAKVQTVDLFTFHFTHTFLTQFTEHVKLANMKEEVLSFRHTSSFTKLFSLCSRKRVVLDALLTHNYNGSMENIFVNAKIHELLLYSLECLLDEKEEGFACKFLTNEDGRKRIYKAREILLQHIGEPITIKQLSKRVATNECYLKKGFKEIFGTTIFDFYQQQRMEHAKYLLYEKGLSVTDVSALLGYSSISHFSTAFKRHTGLKPCELLNPQ